MKLTMKMLEEQGYLDQIQPVAIAADDGVLACALEEALGSKHSRDMSIIYGEDYSIRLLLTHLREGSPHAQDVSPTRAAVEFMRLAQEEARYPTLLPEGQCVKAWRVQKILFDGRPAALVSAAWLT